MADAFTLTAEEEIEWKEWLDKLTECVRVVAARLPCWKLYRLPGPNGKRVTISSYDEHKNGTVSVTVHVSGDFNHVAFERSVFRVDPNGLVECELPLPGEVVGALGTDPSEALRAAGVGTDS